MVFGLIAMIAGLTASPAGAQDPDADSIAEIAVADGQFTLLITALGAAGLDSVLADCDSDDVYTVFAPTDTGFTAALEEFGIDGTSLLTNVDLVTSFLQYHLLGDVVDAATVVGLDGTDVTTENGEDISIALDGDTVTIVHGGPQPANVVTTDIEACNGIIHVIDTPLISPTIAADLGIPSADDLADTGVTSDAVAIAAVALVAAGAMVAAASRRLRVAG
jgi:uncharacterized surface protein with fasciclin (FAS1) repeats